MSANNIHLHRDGAASGGLAAAICLAVTQLIGLIISSDTIAANLLWGLSLSAIAFGGTYAGVFFASLAAGRRSAPRPSEGPTGSGAAQPTKG